MPPRTQMMPKRLPGESVQDFAKRVEAWTRGDDIPNVQPDLANIKTAKFHLNREDR